MSIIKTNEVKDLDNVSLLKKGEAEKVVNTISDLLSVNTAAFKSVRVLNYHSDVTGGGGLFYWDATGDKADHNGGTVIDPAVAFPTSWADTAQQTTWFTALTGTGVWRRQYDDDINIKWFGAKADGITNNTKSFEKAETIASDVIKMPEGSYVATTYSPTAGISFLGSGVFLNKGIPVKDNLPDTVDVTKHQILQDAGVALKGSEVLVSGFPEYKPCFDAQGYLWVPQFNDVGESTSFVSKIDTTTGEVLLTKVVHKGAYACIHDPLNNRIWVTCAGTEYNNPVTIGSQIYILDALTGDTVHTITDFAATVKLGGGLYEPESQSIWVADGNNSGNQVFKYNPNTFAYITAVTVGLGPTGMAYAPFPKSTGDIYVVCYASAEVYRVDPTTETVVTSALIGVNPVDITFEPITNSLFVSDNINGSVGAPADHGVFKIDPADCTEIARTSTTEFDPFGICFDNHTETILCMCYTDGKINQIDPTTGQLVHSFPTTAGGGCQGVISDINNPGHILTTSNGIRIVNRSYIGRSSSANAPDLYNRATYTAVAETIQAVDSTSPLTIDASLGSIVYVAALTSDLTLNVPENGIPGQTLRIRFLQDATGGWVVYASGAIQGMTAGTGFVQSGNTAGKYTWVEIMYDGSGWQKVRPENPYI